MEDDRPERFSIILAILNWYRGSVAGGFVPNHLTPPHSVLALINNYLLFTFTLLESTFLWINKINMSAEGAITKRPYSAVDIESNAGSSALVGTARAAPKQKTTANPTAARKATTTQKSTATKALTVDKLYNDSIKKIEKDLKILDGRVVKMGPDSRAVTTDSYAKMSSKHLDTVKKLDQMDGGLVSAFDLMLYVADASHTDCEITGKMSGYGESEGPFGLLDTQLLELIEKRHAQTPATRQDQLPSLPEQWRRPDADVWVIKFEWLVEQNHTEMKRLKLGLEQDRREKRHERRVTVDDWVAVALQDLEEERVYLEAYGVDEYFPKSIDRLKDLMKHRASTAAIAPEETAA